MQKLKFHQLDAEEKSQAISEMIVLVDYWQSTKALEFDTQKGYNPDSHFVFMIDEEGEFLIDLK